MTFRRVLDAEMKEATRMGVTLKTKRDEKEAVNSEEEELFWSKGLFGQSSPRSLLNTVYFYNGKLFGLRASELRSITFANVTEFSMILSNSRRMFPKHIMVAFLIRNTSHIL